MIFVSVVTCVAKTLSPVPVGLTETFLVPGREIGTGKRRATLLEFWPLPILLTSQTFSFLRILHTLLLPLGRLSLPQAKCYSSFRFQLKYHFTHFPPSQVPLFLFLFLIYFY